VVCTWGVGVQHHSSSSALNRSVQLQAAAALAPVPFEQGIGWVPKHGWALKEETKIARFCHESKFGHPASSLDTTLHYGIPVPQEITRLL
jgi:hypothetical protein